MLVWIFAISLIKVSKCAVDKELVHLDLLRNVAQFGDAEHRGPNFYDFKDSEESELSTLERKDTSSSLSQLTYSDSISDTYSDSSIATSEKKRVTQFYRSCTPCIHDMLKKHTNIGIKWLCGGYQRARRTFKSECMMRYRNCQDGTMFVKMYEGKCKHDPYHGKSWFYVYRV